MINIVPRETKKTPQQLLSFYVVFKMNNYNKKNIDEGNVQQWPSRDKVIYPQVCQKQALASYKRDPTLKQPGDIFNKAPSLCIDG